MIKLKMRELSALIAGLLLAAPMVEASVEGSTVTFSPGVGLKPAVGLASGTVGAGQRVTTGPSEVRRCCFPMVLRSRWRPEAM